MFIFTKICYYYYPMACGISTINSFMYGYNFVSVPISHHWIFHATNAIMVFIPVHYLAETQWWPWHTDFKWIAIKAHLLFGAIGYTIKFINIDMGI